MSAEHSIPGLQDEQVLPLLGIAELLLEDCSSTERLNQLLEHILALYHLSGGGIALGRVEDAPGHWISSGLSAEQEAKLAGVRLEDLASSALDLGFGYAAAFPLDNQRSFHGMLFVTDPARTPGPGETHAIATLARLLAANLDRAQLSVRESAQRKRTRALSVIVRAIHSTADTESVLGVIADQLAPLLPFSRLLLLARRVSGHYGVLSVSTPGGNPVPIVRVHTPATETARVEAAITEGRIFVVHVGEDPVLVDEPGFLDGLAQYGFVPITAGEEPLGALCCGCPERKTPSSEDLDLLGDIALHLSSRLSRELNSQKPRPDEVDIDHANGLRTLGEMVAGVAHDINNVLSAILGRAQMLRPRLQDEDQLKSLGVIEKAALDGASTVRRIQEFAKKSAEELQPVELNQLVSDTAERAHTRVLERELKEHLDIRIELGTDAEILGSPSELRQVLTNLIYNAIDAMPDGGMMTIRTGQDPSSGRAFFEVEDTGSGIDEDTRRRMFAPFYTTKGARGTGLGLSVSYGIVQRHGGELSVFSEKGRGSRLRVSIPAIGQSKRPAGSPADRKGPSPLLRRTRTCGSILLIDDDAAVRETLAEILASEDHEVTTADSGPDGVRRFEEGTFDLVLTDLGMPDMNGWEVAERIKKLSPGTPVGVITGWSASLDENRISEYGVDLIVSKPFRYEQVLEVVSKVLGGKPSD